MSLEELKRENAEAESASQDEPQTDENDDVEVVEESEEEAESTEGSEDQANTKEDDIEAWMHGEDDNSPNDSETVPLSDLIKMRTKLKSKVHDKDDQIQELKAKIESMEQSLRQQPEKAASGKPNRGDFLEHDDPEEAYIDALTEWKSGESRRKAEAEEAENRLKAQRQELDRRVESHYQRVSELLDTHKIKPDVYKAADLNLRKAADAALPGHGDMVFDALISQIGEGSDKLVMYVGNNQARRAEFQQAMVDDPNGLKAMRLIGKWESEMSKPVRRTSSAPPPARDVDKDASTVSQEGMRRKYKSAHEKGDVQKAFDLKREARAKNIDVSNW
jgi:hypothetical protein